MTRRVLTPDGWRYISNSLVHDGTTWRTLGPQNTGTPPVTPPPSPSPNLWFAMEARGASSPLVFGHYFGPYPPRINLLTPSADYYANNYLKIQGESGIHAAYGGLLRNRPYPKPIGGSQILDAKEAIEDAVAAGLDGFYCNLMNNSLSQPAWPAYLALRDAAVTYHPSFRIIPMVDGSASIASYSDAVIVSMLHEFETTTHYLNDERMYVGTFKMEGISTAKWNSIANLYNSTYGKTLAFAGVFNNVSANIASYKASLGSSLYAAGNWGSGADPNFVSSVKATILANGCLHHAPWWWQDNRPKSYLFDENRGTEVHRKYATQIITDQSPIIQICTWSDYSEGSSFCRSSGLGYSLLDLTAYEISRIRRGGSEPVTLVDTVFVTHRARVASTTPVASPAGAQTSGFMVHWVGGGRPASGQSAVTYDAEVITFLTASSDTNGVIITIDGVQHTFTATAGRNVFRVPLAAGAGPSVVVKRGGATVATLDSPITVRAEAWQQNMEQFVIGSNRPADQFDAMQTNTGTTPVYP